MREKKFTPEELDWLRENYPIKSDHECRCHLHISYQRMYILVAEMGLHKSKPSKTQLTMSQPKKSIYLDENAPGGFCMDCKRYVSGGQCGRNGKSVGALWVKKCFK